MQKTTHTVSLCCIVSWYWICSVQHRIQPIPYLRASYIPSLTHTPSPTPYLLYPSLLTSLRKYWYLVQNDPLLSALFPTPPQFCFRKKPPLHIHWCRFPGSYHPPQGQVPPIPIPRLDSDMMQCADKRCKVCPNTEGRRVLFSMVSNTPYTFHETFTHTDTYLIYCILCNYSVENGT